jgi:DNA-binding transcriptional regulator LsrR (DeoR family)
MDIERIRADAFQYARDSVTKNDTPKSASAISAIGKAAIRPIKQVINPYLGKAVSGIGTTLGQGAKQLNTELKDVGLPYLTGGIGLTGAAGLGSQYLYNRLTEQNRVRRALEQYRQSLMRQQPGQPMTGMQAAVTPGQLPAR